MEKRTWGVIKPLRKEKEVWERIKGNERLGGRIMTRDLTGTGERERRGTCGRSK